MLLEDALGPDGSILVRGLNWNGACELNADIHGASQHVSAPNRYRLTLSGHLLGGMSSAIARLDETGAELRVNVDRKEQSLYMASLPLSGEQELRTSSGIVLSDSDRGVVMSAAQRFELSSAGNCPKIQAIFRRSAIERTLSDILGRRVDELLVFSESMDAVNGLGAAWWRMVKHHHAEIERARELYGCGTFGQAIEATLIKGLLLSQPSNYSAEIKQALNIKVPEYVVRCRSFIEANFRETIRLEDIEAAAGVSRLKLFETFRKHTGFTPAAYLKDYRLRQARAQLQQDRSNQNVSSIALGVGFNHLGRFAIDYKRVFAEAPSDTIRRVTRCA